jgi:hypothetical protein
VLTGRTEAAAIGYSRRLLAMEPQQVVLGQTETTDRCLCLQAAMWSMPIVAMQASRAARRFADLSFGKLGHKSIREARFG